MRKIMCKIGLHKWNTDPLDKTNPKRICTHCEKKQGLYRMFVNLYTGEPIISWKTE